MKALVVLSQLPMLEGGASGRCSVGLMRGLRSHGVDVRALAAQHAYELDVRIPPDLLVDVVAVRRVTRGRYRTYLDQLRRPFWEMRRGAFASMLKTLAADADVLHLEETDAGFGSEGVSVPAVWHIHCLVRRDRSLGWPWQKRGRWGAESYLAERAAIRNYRYLVASSPLVADALREAAPHAEVVHAPLTIDPDFYPPAPLDGPPTVGLIGNASWPPTLRAMRRLVESAWPAVRRLVPEARLLVAGRMVDDLVPRGAGAGGVEVLGEVPSSVEFLHRLSVLLYPLDRGSGMKVKVLESIACGLPVVTTPEGAEGVDADGGVAVETDDVRLAEMTAEILTDDAERKQRGQAARRAFESRYAPGPATEPLVDLYARMSRA